MAMRRFGEKEFQCAESVKVVAEGPGLRFFTSTTRDFAAFPKAVTQELFENRVDPHNWSARLPRRNGTEAIGKGAAS